MVVPFPRKICNPIELSFHLPGVRRSGGSGTGPGPGLGPGPRAGRGPGPGTGLALEMRQGCVLRNSS